MEANRKRPSLSFSGSSCSEINGGPVGSKVRRPESPRKRPRPRSSTFLSHDRVKDLRSHRVFSPSSELSWDMVTQKLGLEKIDSGLSNDDRGFDNGVAASERTEVSDGNIDSDPKTKSLIRPCVRGKVYKTPGSVSYKRLLPYLMNISGSNPCDREIDRCSKLDKGLEEKKLQAAPESSNQDDCTNESRLTSPKTVAPLELEECRNGHIQEPDCYISPPVSLGHHYVNKIKGEDEEIVKCSEEDTMEPVVVDRIESQKQAEEKNQKVDDPNEQSNQMTPPDPEIYVRPDVERSEADRPDCVSLHKDNLNGNLSNGVNHEIPSLVYNTSHDINSKCKGISRPRSQMKLFKCPGSFSYRRMLPFLMDIANDKFDSPASGQLQKPALLASDNQEIHPGKSDIGFEENRKEVSSASVNEETREPLSIEVVSDTHCVLETPTSSLALVESEHDKSRPVSLLFSSNSESKSKEELAITESDRPSFSSRIPCGGPKKGILKRNPRGCRGLCNCLNCASFRLNAERAFEFSRNQMEDTEELVVDLVNELAYLRNVLEKTADLASHVNQVKEACKKASEAEEVAKNRLSLMNYDLGIHCRITCVERPRIKFSNLVEEHLIPKPNAEEPKQEQ